MKNWLFLNEKSIKLRFQELEIDFSLVLRCMMYIFNKLLEVSFSIGFALTPLMILLSGVRRFNSLEHDFLILECFI